MKVMFSQEYMLASVIKADRYFTPIPYFLLCSFLETSKGQLMALDHKFIFSYFFKFKTNFIIYRC